MTQKHPSAMRLAATLIKRVLIGIIIGLAVISLFVFRVPHPKPEWGTWWRVRPLIITPLVGALCGLCYHILQVLFNNRGWSKVLAIILSILGYIIGIWLGIVLGLKGTMWN